MSALQPYVDGVVIPASQLTQRDPLFAVKLSDQTVNNNATFQNDSALFVTVQPNATYKCELHFVFNSGATPSLKTQFTGPAGATFTGWQFFLPNASNQSIQGLCNAQAGVGGITCTGADLPGYYRGLLVVVGTGGNFQLQWAQNTANASNSILRANSFLELRQVA